MIRDEQSRLRQQLHSLSLKRSTAVGRAWELQQIGDWSSEALAWDDAASLTRQMARLYEQNGQHETAERMWSRAHDYEQHCKRALANDPRSTQ